MIKFTKKLAIFASLVTLSAVQFIAQASDNESLPPMEDCSPRVQHLDLDAANQAAAVPATNVDNSESQDQDWLNSYLRLNLRKDDSRTLYGYQLDLIRRWKDEENMARSEGGFIFEVFSRWKDEENMARPEGAFIFSVLNPSKEN